MTEAIRLDVARDWSLAQCRTRTAALYASKHEYRRRLDAAGRSIRAAQQLLRADGRSALLFIVQGMDAAGKDGAIRHVFGGIDPQACRATSFERPAEREQRHDFLWRYVPHLPERGQIGIFNRSYYEDVLAPRVHPELLVEQRIEPARRGALWRERYRAIVDWERHLQGAGTRVVKLFLHVSAGEQRRRLLRRIERPDRNWKIALDDVADHRRWRAYFDAYDECLRHTCAPSAPWFVVPADDKRNARLLVADIVCQTLDALRLRYPEPSRQRLRELKKMRRLLA